MRKIICIAFIIAFAVNNITAQVDSKAIKINNEAYDLLSFGKYKEAIIGFNNAIKIDSTYYLFYQNRAYANYFLKNDSNALTDYSKAIEINPEVPDLYYSIGNIYQRNTKYKESAENYTNAIYAGIQNNDKSNLYMYYFNRGNVYLEMKKYSKSISDYDSTEKANSNFNDLYQNRGIAKYQIKDFEGACIDWFIASKYGFENAEKYFEENCDSAILKEHLISAEFPGGNFGFRKYVANNLFYPPHCRDNGYQGTVFLRFEVDKNGKILILDIHSLTCPDLTVEAIETVMSSEEYWKPASITGKSINTTYSIPVTFRLNDGYNYKGLKKRALKYIESKKYKEAEPLFNSYLAGYPFDTIIIKKYIELKRILKDTADIERYKHKIGQSDVKSDFFKKFKKDTIQQNGISIIRNLNLNVNKTFYYNNKYELTEKENASFYRIAFWNPNLSHFDSTFRDFNTNGKLIHSGAYTNGFKDGIFKFYYLDTTVLKSEGEYKKNIMSGLWRFYHKTGQIKDETVIQGNHFKVISSYSESGDTLVKVGTGQWLYKIKSWDGKGDMYISGNFKNGLKDGEWILKDDIKILVEELYKNGKFIKGKYYQNKKPEKISEPLITSWIFVSPYLQRMEKLMVSNEKIKK